MQGDGMTLFAQLLGVLIVIFLAYAGTKWLSKKYSKISSGRNMKVIERVSLGQDKSIVLMCVGKRTYLLGISPKGIDVIKDFDQEELELEPESTEAAPDFLSLFNDFSKKIGGASNSLGNMFGNTLGSKFKNFPSDLSERFSGFSEGGFKDLFPGSIKDFYMKNGRKHL